MPHDHVVPSASRRTRALQLSLVANGVLLAAEVAGGVIFGSLALLADAGHMLSDVVALAIALMAQRLARAPASSRLTYGLQRAEVLGAMLNAVLLAGVSLWIVVEAVRRLGEPQEVVGGGVLAVASLGLIVNAWSATLLLRTSGRSLNMRGAWLHMAADAAGSAGAMAAGVAVLVWGATGADALISIAIALIAASTAWGLLRSTIHVLLEGAPPGLGSEEVERALAEDSAVEAVHHLHLWNIASETPALSAHVVLAGEVSLHEAQLRGEELKEMLSDRFGIGHSTLELECHHCGPDAERTHGGDVVTAR